MKKKTLLFTMVYICLFASVSKSQQRNLLTNELYSSTALLVKPSIQKSIFETTGSFTYKMIKNQEHWKKLRNNGIVLTSLGAACIITGAALVQADVHDVGGNADGTRAVFGIMGIAGGITSLGGGITMWAIGNNRLKKIRDVSFNSNGKALGFVYRF